MLLRWVLLVPLVVASCGTDDDTGAATTVGNTTVPSVTVRVPTTMPESVTVPRSTAVPESTTGPAGVVPEGFPAEAGVITAADGTICEVCLWVAATPEQHTRGLMGVTDLGGADGMLFLWDAPVEGNFWMRGTPLPLSIAFFAADGSFVSSADMVPCLDGPATACASYGADGPYSAAIEVPVGELGSLGIADGSHLQLLGASCQPAAI